MTFAICKRCLIKSGAFRPILDEGRDHNAFHNGFGERLVDAR